MKWTKPNGTKIETVGDKETVAYCKGLGWKEFKEPAPAPIPVGGTGKGKAHKRAESKEA